MPQDHNHSLAARIEELERNDRAKDRFLSLLSHELRNHLHAIRTNVWLIQARNRDAEIIRGVFLRGSGMGVLWPEAAALFGMGLVIMAVASMRFRKRLD